MNCNICPRKCNADREHGEKGVCSVTGHGIYVSRASLHMWEEPCISGKEGSGTIFFSGCNLRCVFCQNKKISRGIYGKEISEERLAQICIELEEKGANNINLVTPTHYADKIKAAIILAKKKGLSIPIVYNTGGYEDEKTLKNLEEIVDIYLTDFKYIHEDTAFKYSKAGDYPQIAKKALKEMVRQKHTPVFDEKGMMKKGVIVRFLLLPMHVNEGKEIIKYLYDTYGDSIYISIMSQYTPSGDLTLYPEINRPVTHREYKRLISYAMELGINNAFIQEGDAVGESFIPDFEADGL